MKSILLRTRHYIRLLLLSLPGGASITIYIDKLLLRKQQNARIALLQQHWGEIHNKIYERLSKAGLRYCADFGTLIGLLRENGPIKHDEDIDYIVPPGESLAAIIKTLRSNEFTLLHGFTVNGELQEVNFRYKGIGIDFFRCHMIGEKLGHYVFIPTSDNKSCRIINTTAHERIRPNLTGITVSNFGSDSSVTVPIPTNADEMLTASYGNWRIPDKKTDFCSKEIPSQYRDILEGCKYLTGEEVIQLLSPSAS